jgi:hypothetical protein
MFMSATKELCLLASQLPRVIDAIESELRTVKERMKMLQKAGLIYASEHWREKKYLYLIHPMRDGDRRREYIGADENRIAGARAGIERGRQFNQLSANLKELEARTRNGVAALRAARRELLLSQRKE